MIKNKKAQSNLSKYFKTALGVFLTGFGIALVGKSDGNWALIIFGFVFIGVGVSILVS